MRAKLESKDSFYQKLKDGIDVDILIVGDSIGEGAGASDNDHIWPTILKSYLKRKYDISVNLLNVSMGGNSSYAGYVRVAALNDDIDYDAVIICYGQNDVETDFSLYYESILRVIKAKYPDAAILSILESSQKEYTKKMNIICSLAKRYHIPTIDLIAPFQDHYNELVTDGVHPNDAGQQIYADKVAEVIDEKVKAYESKSTDIVSPANDRVVSFDHYTWHSFEEFTRKGNTFRLSASITGTILGIDYIFVSGKNTCKIYLDGIEFAAPEVSFDYDFSQRHILVLNSAWDDTDKDMRASEIVVEFGNEEQADGFKGIMISW